MSKSSRGNSVGKPPIEDIADVFIRVAELNANRQQLYIPGLAGVKNHLGPKIGEYFTGDSCLPLFIIIGATHAVFSVVSLDNEVCRASKYCVVKVVSWSKSSSHLICLLRAKLRA